MFGCNDSRKTTKESIETIFDVFETKIWTNVVQILPDQVVRSPSPMSVILNSCNITPIT
jgi:hypothetical protein